MQALLELVTALHLKREEGAAQQEQPAHHQEQYDAQASQFHADLLPYRHITANPNA
jgi:hypothetical protein